MIDLYLKLMLIQLRGESGKASEINVDKKCLKPSLKNPTHLFYQVNKNLKICFFNGKKEVEGEGDIILLGYFNKNTFFKNSLNIDFMVEEAIK